MIVQYINSINDAELHYREMPPEQFVVLPVNSIISIDNKRYKIISYEGLIVTYGYKSGDNVKVMLNPGKYI